jgi:subtilase family serine protease
MRKKRIAASIAIVAVVIGTALIAVSGDSLTVTRATVAAGRAVASTSPASEQAQIRALNTVVGNIDRRVAAGLDNWGFLDLRDVLSYKVDRLWAKGVDGSGTAVAVLEGWDDPHIQSDLTSLDAQLGLPDTTIDTVFPSGPLPAQCPAGMVALGSYGSCDAWQEELELDVESVHLMAPYATIVIAATPSDSEVVGDASSEVAMPEMVKGMEYVGQHQLANVMSSSNGSSETDYSHGAAEIRAQDPGELTAAAAGVPIANSTGDCGAAQNLTTATSQCGSVSSGPASATWGDSPWVTAVGGSTPTYVAPCPPCVGASGEDRFVLDPIEGAGLSEIYGRPDYQNAIKSISGSDMRSVPDITMNSANGTSEAAPLFAGILALATQVKGSNLGPINEVLYTKLARKPAANGLVDVTSGNDHLGSIPGYTAGPGYDVASGWGTVDASLFVPALAKAANANPMPQQAASALRALENTLSITPSDHLGSTATIDVTSTGFLPGHPVTIEVDGTLLTTVTADTSGNFSYAFTAASKGFAAGPHTLNVTSMLLQQSATFTIT